MTQSKCSTHDCTEEPDPEDGYFCKDCLKAERKRKRASNKRKRARKLRRKR